MSPYLPSPFDHYFAMWNERDLDLVRTHLDRAVTAGFIFCDPLNDHTGRDALEHNVREFRAKYPNADLALASGIDSHHNRHRYGWHIIMRGRLMMQGFDVATIATTTAENGLIERVDGFFGPLPPLADVPLATAQ